MNCACLPVGQAELEFVITNVVMDVALMRTSAPWSLYSRSPLGEQHVTEKPNVAWPLVRATLSRLSRHPGAARVAGLGGALFYLVTNKN